MATDREIRKYVEAWDDYDISEILLEYLKLRALLRKADIHCSKPSGRFGEDECGKCACCKIISLRESWTRE